MNAPDSVAILEVENLAYSYGARRAVDGLSFEVRRGECFGFLGPNGAGKTTALSCIIGLLEGWSGVLRFDGVERRPGRDPALRARIGYVPQELALYEELSARENLAFFGRIQGLEGAELAGAVDRSLAIAGLGDRARDRVEGFSGGMKRRLNLAAAELHSPELLLLDEPTAGVDPQSRNHLFEALSTLLAEGRTLIYTTHYMEEAERLCDRVLILNDGRAAACGTHQELAAQAGVPDADLERVFLELTGRSLRDEAA
ncbi:MAG: ABC transporter ATP-binding protein [Planctomycetota bacterium]|nr:ABC transporter ATP-binding protein [Planctomycetota bacterium]